MWWSLQHLSAGRRVINKESIQEERSDTTEPQTQVVITDKHLRGWSLVSRIFPIWKQSFTWFTTQCFGCFSNKFSLINVSNLVYFFHLFWVLGTQGSNTRFMLLHSFFIRPSNAISLWKLPVLLHVWLRKTSHPPLVASIQFKFGFTCQEFFLSVTLTASVQSEEEVP